MSTKQTFRKQKIAPTSHAFCFAILWLTFKIERVFSNGIFFMEIKTVSRTTASVCQETAPVYAEVSEFHFPTRRNETSVRDGDSGTLPREHSRGHGQIFGEPWGPAAL